MEFVQLRCGVILHVPTRCRIKLKGEAEGKCRKHPHGFINGKRVYGFWAAFNAGIIKVIWGEYLSRGCGCCGYYPNAKVILA